LDGGYGTEQTPADLDTIADIVRFVQILERRGYSQADLEGICHKNFISLLRNAWTQAP
jgi:membrane dipeptidase